MDHKENERERSNSTTFLKGEGRRWLKEKPRNLGMIGRIF